MFKLLLEAITKNGYESSLPRITAGEMKTEIERLLEYKGIQDGKEHR